MKCSQIQSLLSEYLDGDLSPVQAAHVREHLDECCVCEARWRMLRQTVRLVAHMGTERCPVDLRASVSLAVQERYTGTSRRSPFFRVALLSGASTAVAAAAVGVVLFRTHVNPATLPIPQQAQAAVVAEAPVHEQYDLATGLGTADGLLLSLPERGERNERSAQPERGPYTN